MPVPRPDTVKIVHPDLEEVGSCPVGAFPLWQARGYQLADPADAVWLEEPPKKPGRDVVTADELEPMIVARLATVPFRFDTAATARDRHEAGVDPDGLVLTDPTGDQYRLVVDAAGALSTSPLPTPPTSTVWPLLGIHTPEGRGSAELSTTERLIGERATIVPVYVDWASGVGFPREECDRIVAAGGRPLITWEPFDSGAGATQPAYTLASIIAGAHDATIDAFAGGLMETDYPEASKVLIRFAHEMNGNWYPWCESVNGNAPGQYVQAWNRVLDRVNGVGGWQKSDFLWCPNALFEGGTPLAGLFPGGDRCSFVGLDAFNFGTTDQFSTWKSPWETIGPTLTEIRAIAPNKAVLICETGCAPSEGGNSQAAWAAELVRMLHEEQGDVMAFVWFSERKYDELALGQTEPTDWRLTSSQATYTAMRQALAARRSS